MIPRSIRKQETMKLHDRFVKIAIQVIIPLISIVEYVNSAKCSRTIEGTTVPRSPAAEKYEFTLTLYNRTDVAYTYMPNTRYTVALLAKSTGQMPRKFIRFLISVEAENVNDTTDVGTFDLEDDLAKFSSGCPNTVVETSQVSKERVAIAWNSPTEDSGCLLIRATVLETMDTWHMDDSNLVLNVCQDPKAEADDQGLVLPECCACDEAKYEVTFEGLWSRNTHPKDFPSKGWVIRFSDVIGASHTVDYSFWQYNGMASQGLQLVAERGSTRQLESELKDQSEHIRTIIKARGISYPNVTGKTFAVFRVDRKHHLMSLVSMIDPSPDWIVGVSGLELCLSNCSWIEHKELNLYPYDAGTDSGITYLSEDSATDPHELIRRITSSYPDDPKSPFYEATGIDMKPLAKLYLNRQRLYEKTCDDSNGDTSGDTGADTNERPRKRNKNKACRVSSWGEWTDCSVTCGKGSKLRQRKYRDEAAAITNKCSTLLTDRTTCYGSIPHCDHNGRYNGILETEMCALDEWSSWSSCTSTCGSASKTRSRNFRHRKHRKQCRIVPDGPELQQTIDCENSACEDEDREEVRSRISEQVEDSKDEGEENNEADDNEEEDFESEGMEVTEEWLQKCPQERYTDWSMWSPCSSSCGPGVKLRSRLVNKNWSSMGNEGSEEDDSLEECKVQQASCVAAIRTCNFSNENAEKICGEPMMKGRCNNNILRVYFDKTTGRCRLFSYSGCEGNRNNFQTEKDCYNVCGNYQTNSESSKSVEFRGLETRSHLIQSTEAYDDDEAIDCQLSEWSKWSHCDGCQGYTTSTREILVSPRNDGKSCPKKLTRKRKCRNMPPCSLRGDGDGRRFNRDRNSETEQNEISVGCYVTQWSSWSRCTAPCGESLQYRTRTVKGQPNPQEELCLPVEFRTCPTIYCPN